MADPQQTLEDRIGDQFDPFKGEQAPKEPEQQATEVEETEPVATAEAEAEESTETEETVSETKETQPANVEVEFNGKTYEVPEELKDALIHGSDYTRKTQDVARQHEAADMRADALQVLSDSIEFENSLSEERETLSLMDAQIKQYKALDWSEFSTEQSLQHKMSLDNLKEQKAEIESSITTKRSDWGTNRDKALQVHMEKSSDWLRKSIQGWNQDVANEVAQDAISVGYTEQEVNSIIDPRAVRTMYESMKYRQLKVGSDKAKLKASTAAPVIKPGSVKTMPPAVRDKLNFKKQMSGLKKSKASESDTSKAILKRLEQTIGNL